MKDWFIVNVVKTALKSSLAVAKDGLAGFFEVAFDEIKGSVEGVINITAGTLWNIFKYLFHELYFVLFEFIFPETFSLASSAGVEFVGFCEKSFGGSNSIDFIYYLFGFTIIIFLIKLIMKIVK